MPKVLVSALGSESLTYVRRCRLLGMSVKVLDCFESHHKQLSQWFGDDVLHVVGRRLDVRSAVEGEGFHAAIVQENDDFVKAALIVQSLREAGVNNIVVVTPDAAKRVMYRRFGAQHVVVAGNVEQAWMAVTRWLPSFATA